MRRPPRSRCGVCGKRNAELRNEWGAPVCGSCSGEQDLRGWLAELAAVPEQLLDDPWIEPERVRRPPRPPDRQVTDTDQLPIVRPEHAEGYGPLRPLRLPPFTRPRPPPARPDGTDTWVDQSPPPVTRQFPWRVPHVR